MLKKCEIDGVEFEAARDRAKYCSARCRKRAQRQVERAGSDQGALSVLQGGRSRDRKPGPLELAARRRLEKSGRVDSDMGVAALLAARRLDDVGLRETGAGFAALMREYRSAMAEAVQVDDNGGGDLVDEIQKSAALKLVGHGRRAPARA